MKLEFKFFNSFFYPFIISATLCSLIVTIFLGLFTNTNYDERTRNNIIELEKKNVKININSANKILTTTFQKVQSGLNEHILFYQRMANKLLKSQKNHILNTNLMYYAYEIPFFYCYYAYGDYGRIAIWVQEEDINQYNVDSKKDVYLELISFSNILQNMDANIEAINTNINYYFFYFEKNELLQVDISILFKWLTLIVLNNVLMKKEIFIKCINLNVNYIITIF